MKLEDIPRCSTDSQPTLQRKFRLPYSIPTEQVVEIDVVVEIESVGDRIRSWFDRHGRAVLIRSLDGMVDSTVFVLGLKFSDGAEVNSTCGTNWTASSLSP